MSALYNEIEPYAAQWIRNLAAAGHVAPGVVDERSIKEVQPDELGNGQVHLFAGIAVWSHALRMAGYPDDFPIWSASCPCQPFSAAGRGEGVDDPRHLWPDAFRLIKARRPVVVVGEQVSAAEAVGKFRAGTRKRAPSASGSAWIDAVHADLESAGYAVGFVVFPAASVGAPHQRHRLYWAAIRADASDRLAHHHQQRLSQQRSDVPQDGHAQPGDDADRRGETLGLADTAGLGQHGRRAGEASDGGDASRVESERLRDAGGLGDAYGEHPRGDAGASDRAQGGSRLRAGGDEPCASGAAGRLGFAGFAGLQGHAGDGNASGESGRVDSDAARSASAPGPTNGHWASVEWLPCRDDKWRPAELRTLEVVDGSSGRVERVRAVTHPLAREEKGRAGKLKAYGNAIVGPQAKEFLEVLRPFVEHHWRAA